MRVLTVFPLKKEIICFVIGLYFLFFSDLVFKANVNGLFGHISGHFISILHK